MAVVLEHRRMGTTARLALVPADGELIWDTDTHVGYMGDGATAGGIPLGGATARRILTKTANYTVLTGDTGTHFNNIGATGEVDFTLPAAAVGLNYVFAIFAAQTLKIITNGGDLLKSDVFSASNISNNVPYSVLSLEAHGTGIWVIVSATGAWG